MGGCQSSRAATPAAPPPPASKSPSPAPTTAANSASAPSTAPAPPQSSFPPPAPQSSPPPPREKTPVDFILDLTDGRPLDASDVTSLDAAQAELKKIRQFARDFLDQTDLGDANDVSSSEQQDDYGNVGVRGALYDKQDFSSFKKISYDKTEKVRALIYDALRPNVLFEHDTQEEMLAIIDIFKPVSFKAGQVVISQGDEGSEFYVVESGELSIHATVRGGGGGGDASQLRVGDYSAGSAFGELALIFGSPRAATITAATDCRLWCVERTAYRSVISQLRYEQHKEKSAFLRTCVVSERSFSEIFDAYQIEDLSIATKQDHYEAGEIILREGEMGDTFYIVKSGVVETYKNDGRTKHGIIERTKTFGTTSLLKNMPSPLTYRAGNGPVTVYYLTRNDFEDIMGSFKDALDGNTVTRSMTKSKSKRSVKTSLSLDSRYECPLEELEFFNQLGRGAFGQVRLVQSKKTKKLFALKVQSKDYIAKKGQKEHVLNEYRILREFEDPYILGIHCAMQDERHLYFMLDLLPGGELMSYLHKHARMGKGFTEDVTRFYAASVVLAFDQLHSLMIAYRDLKPENIVLTKKGYGVLVDFGLAKEIEHGQTYTFCGTPDYLAPEIIRATGHDWAVDYWGLGVFLFEMTNGLAPFYATNQARRTRKILKGYENVSVPSHFSPALRDLIENLLVFDQSKRLGRTQNGIHGILNHRWFAGFDWDSFKDQNLDAPIQPSIPEDIKTMGKKTLDHNTPFQDATTPQSDWWPDLEHLKDW